MKSTNESLPVVNQPTGSAGASSRGSHQLSCAKQCQRKWVLRYRKRIVPIAEPKFRLLGTLIHVCLADHYARMIMDDGGPAPTWWTGDDLDTQLMDAGGEGYPDLIQHAKDNLAHYKQTYAGEPWIPVSVEEEYRARVGDLDPGGIPSELDNEVVTCGTDLIVRNNGMLWIVDHKSKGGGWGWGKDRLPKWEGKDEEEYRVHWQAMINLHLVRRAFPTENVAGFIVNRTKREPPFDLDRHVLEIPAKAYVDVPRVIRECVREEAHIDGMIAAGTRAIPSYWECNGKYGPCDYLDLCAAQDDETMRTALQMKYKSRD